jgi:hypothetical protein
VARNILSDYVTIPKKDTHKFVICEYSTASDSEVGKVGENLKRLWRKRKMADYDNEIDIREGGRYQSDFDAVDATNKKARKIIQQIRTLKSDGFISASTFSEEHCR